MVKMNKKNLAAEKNFLQALENHKKNNIQSAENYYKKALKFKEFLTNGLMKIGQF